MTDINEQSLENPSEHAGKNGGLPDESAAFGAPGDGLIGVAEWLFFAYRDFISDPDMDLRALGFGRAHHRILHFVNRHPGLRVADLLDILKITKQSLGRVLKQLVDQGYIAQQAGQADRRERRLYPTERGQALARRLIEPQIERIAHAIAATGDDGRQAVQEFLRRMVGESEREKVNDLIARGEEPGKEGWSPS